MLVAEGACSPNIENHWMSTPLHVAASNGRKQAVKLLLEHPDIHVVRAQLSVYFVSKLAVSDACARLLENASFCCENIPGAYLTMSCNDAGSDGQEREDAVRLQRQPQPRALAGLRHPAAGRHGQTSALQNLSLTLQLDYKHCRSFSL